MLLDEAPKVAHSRVSELLLRMILLPISLGTLQIFKMAGELEEFQMGRAEHKRSKSGGLWCRIPPTSKFIYGTSCGLHFLTGSVGN